MVEIFKQIFNAVFLTLDRHISAVLFEINSQHVMYIFTSFAFAFLVVLWKKRSLKKIFRNILRYIRTRRFKAELFKDLRYLPLRVVIQALIVVTIGFNTVLIASFIKKTMIFGMGVNWQPVFVMDSVLAVAFQIFVVMLITDFAEFWTHYAGHRVENLWFFHKMHHRATSMNGISKVRFHPVDDYMIGVVRLSVATPLLILFHKTFSVGPSEYKIIIKIILMGLFYFGLNHLRHTHIKIHYPKFLSYILVSPAMHQIHHSIKPEHYDKNFGTIFSFWDIWMGTLYIPKKNEYFKFGILEEKNRILTLRQELYVPFVDLYKKYFGQQSKTVSQTIKTTIRSNQSIAKTKI